MKFSCNTNILSEACLNVSRAVSTKSGTPAIEGICFKTVEQGLELTGYDLEMGINTLVDASIKEEGSTIINAKTICEILKRLPGDIVYIETDERNICKITSGDSEFSIIGISAEEYPELPYVMGGNPIVVDKRVLRDMIRQTIFAVSVNDTRVVHRGIKFQIANDEIKLIALDGYRLAIRKEAINYKDEPISFVVPAKTLSEIIKFVDDSEGYISMGLSRRHIVFSINGYNIVSRLLEGEFLDFTSAMPSSFVTEVSFKTALMLDCADRMSLLSMDKVKSPLKCSFKEEQLKFSISTVIGSANDLMPIRLEGESIEIGFNSRFLTDAVRACDCDYVKMKLSGPLSPACIVPIEGDSFYYMVLPVRLRG